MLRGDVDNHLETFLEFFVIHGQKYLKCFKAVVQ